MSDSEVRLVTDMADEAIARAFEKKREMFEVAAAAKEANTKTNKAIHAFGGEARRSAYTHARTRAAQSLAEETIDIADAASVQEVQLAKLRSDNRWRLAAKLNPETYGDKQQPLINIDLGSMALDALRKRVIDVTPVNGLVNDPIDEG